MGNISESVFGSDFEIILVDDGSTDSSLEIAEAIARNDEKVVLIELSKNFGHHHALLAGVKESRGELVFLIDSDLEEAPELLSDFMDTMLSESCDVVYGVQADRKGSIIERITGEIFYSVFNKLSTVKVTPNLSTIRLMTRKYVNSLLSFQEREIFLGGIWEAVGFRQVGVRFHKRDKGKSSYSLKKKIDLAMRSITSFTNSPLVFLFYFGLVSSLASIVFLGALIFSWLFFETPPDGWTSVMTSIWLFGSLIIFSIGVLGLYLSVIFSEVKARPNYIVRNRSSQSGG
jgi:putative glycosyltransferase